MACKTAEETIARVGTCKYLYIGNHALPILPHLNLQ